MKNCPLFIKKNWIAIVSVLIVIGWAVAGYIYFGKSIADTGSTGKTVVSSGDTIGVDYVGRLEDGTIFDSSLEEFAKQMKNYTPGREFKPLEFTVGAGQMIPGFDAGVVGMKLGEKKTLTIAPKDAYGELQEQEVPAKYLQDIFTETVPRENFKDIVTQTVPMSQLGESGKDLVVGKVIDAGNIKAKVTAIEGDNVTVEIDNTGNPFYGKKLAVGLTGEFEGNSVVIKKLTDKEVTIEVNNKANPFYGKKIEVGMEWKSGENTIKIIAVTKENVTIAAGRHELAGKTLTFDIEIKSIK
ncbi:MAG: hypothetical protein ACD_78C00360G0001 [uncultured bacterium (gcode 4)]|uniref:Peptidyl-prolyl cis-trans isomerase n=1 Tax=uncultured bacterium (gcode 4) TaxID=1234023 RepID=K1YB13_9BACT|nr:MAG: hypothetical protein ACD_78C00360G0001 [uncultured bacterium (gcode 4)]